MIKPYFRKSENLIEPVFFLLISSLESPQNVLHGLLLLLLSAEKLSVDVQHALALMLLLLRLRHGGSHGHRT